jgi:DNA mismatch repair protein MutS2
LNPKTLNILEFPSIKILLAGFAASNLGRKLAGDLTPKTNLSAITDALRETTEARLILDSSGTPPMHGLADIGELLQKVKIGGILDPVSLLAVSDFLRGCRKTREFMAKRVDQAPLVARYAQGMAIFPELEEEINRCVVDGAVSSEASPGLKKVRKEIGRLQEKIKEKLQQILVSPQAREWLQETVVSVKDSRQVLMVKASHKQRVPGIVLGSSGSGSTLFVEPLAVHQLGNELRALEGVEQEEIYQILAGLSGEVSLRVLEIEQNLEIMAQYDLAFAKARLSRSLRGIAPVMNDRDRINLIGARHPLLNEVPVPLDFWIGRSYRSLVITGPNTGGKTVALKTIGLLTMMAQAGLHVPAESGTELAVFQDVLADIGDGQNIAQSLSTFSSHISNIIQILSVCGKNTLVLLDEVGTGTDPAEGAALAIAILEFLHEAGSITVASTHYPEIKHYALSTPGFKNGSMAFDRENLKPLYRLIIGRPGESNALWIAEKLGMAAIVLEKARKHLQPGQMPVAVQEMGEELGEQEGEERPEVGAVGVIMPVAVEVEAGEEPGEPVIKVGDMVEIPYLGEKGVVCTDPDSKGRIKVLVKEKKMELQVKRVKLLIPAEQLYPENYDLNVVLLSKEERKLKHQMERKCVVGVERVVRPEER